VYSFLAFRDGEWCIICGPDKKHKNLEIDHADGDPNNWSPSNLYLVCHQHNCWLRGMDAKKHLRTIRDYSAKNVCVCVKKFSFPGTMKVRDLVDYKQGSPEMQANSYFEVEYREWILGEVNRLGTMRSDDAIYAGAEVVGCSPETTRRYLKKLTSVIGVIKEEKDQYGNKIIRFRGSKE
jgi:hypothetical protein